jgi:hypothetical protein
MISTGDEEGVEIDNLIIVNFLTYGVLENRFQVSLFRCQLESLPILKPDTTQSE